jgi:uncharacterized DUF497 family protein
MKHQRNPGPIFQAVAVIPDYAALHPGYARCGLAKPNCAIHKYGIFYISMADTPSFEWDDAKDRLNRVKHGVSFKEAQTAFVDPARVIAEDLQHGGREPRYFCFGKVGDGVMTVRFTYRPGRIRIFGAGYWRKGKRIYEHQNR